MEDAKSGSGSGAKDGKPQHRIRTTVNKDKDLDTTAGHKNYLAKAGLDIFN